MGRYAWNAVNSISSTKNQLMNIVNQNETHYIIMSISNMSVNSVQFDTV